MGNIILTNNNVCQLTFCSDFHFRVVNRTTHAENSFLFSRQRFGMIDRDFTMATQLGIFFLLSKQSHI